MEPELLNKESVGGVNERSQSVGIRLILLGVLCCLVPACGGEPTATASVDDPALVGQRPAAIEWALFADSGYAEGEELTSDQVQLLYSILLGDSVCYSGFEDLAKLVDGQESLTFEVRYLPEEPLEFFDAEYAGVINEIEQVELGPAFAAGDVSTIVEDLLIRCGDSERISQSGPTDARTTAGGMPTAKQRLEALVGDLDGL